MDAEVVHFCCLTWSPSVWIRLLLPPCSGVRYRGPCKVPLQGDRFLPMLLTTLEFLGRSLLLIVSMMILVAGIVWGIIYLRE